MSNRIKEELQEFLKNANLSTYETNAYMSLLLANDLTARDLSERSGVPTGRIYEILEGLNDKGMIEIQDSRPKKYRVLPFNTAFDNLISYIDRNDKRKLTYLISEAKDLETRIYNSDLFIKQEPTKKFWSTAFGLQSIMSLYINRIHESQQELLMTGFINERTPKILKLGKELFDGIYNAVMRGVRVRYLWSFEYDERFLMEDELEKCKMLIIQAKNRLESLFGRELNIRGFEMKFIYRRIPTLFDIFDSKRVLFKLQNPLEPSRIFAAMNVLDPSLAEELKRTFMNVWLYEAIDFFEATEFVPDLDRKILR